MTDVDKRGEKRSTKIDLQERSVKRAKTDQVPAISEHKEDGSAAEPVRQ